MTWDMSCVVLHMWGSTWFMCTFEMQGIRGSVGFLKCPGMRKCKIMWLKAWQSQGPKLESKGHRRVEGGATPISFPRYPIHVVGLVRIKHLQTDGQSPFIINPS